MKYLNKIFESNDESNKEILEALKDYIKDVDKNWNYITPPDLKKAIEKDSKKYFLLDIRKNEEFKQGHIKGATNIFWKELLNNLDKLPNDKTIVLICYVGHTASQMLTALNLLGYKSIVLKFGMGISPVEGVPVAGWIDYGFPTV